MCIAKEQNYDQITVRGLEFDCCEMLRRKVDGRGVLVRHSTKYKNDQGHHHQTELFLPCRTQPFLE